MVGQKVSHYRITGPLGEGGMGVVYAAVDELLDRPVAMKFPTGVGAPAEELASEARAASRLNHPNVAQIYEYGQTPDGAVFIAMELVHGQTLRDLLRQGPLSVAESLRIIRAVAEALKEAHRQGIIHLDVKSANIALTDRGGVKVLDFGLARSLPPGHTNADDDTTKTLVGEWRGTPSYMSPEQARGLSVDRRSDLFSLGVVMYECLTGRRAFQGTTQSATLLEVVTSTPPAPSSIAPDVPVRLDAIVQRLMAKDPRDRYQSAEAFLADLDAPAPPPRRRGVQTVAVALAAVVLVAAAAWWFPWTWFRGPRAEPEQLVVLPFENLSGQPAHDAFSNGLGEIVTSLLGRTQAFGEAIWVMPSADVRRLAVQTVADAGRTLHATLVVSGGVRREADQYVISVDLSNPSGPKLLGSRLLRISDRDAGDLEPRLTAALGELLQVRLKPAASGQNHPDGAGYARFVEGRGYLRLWDQGDNLDLAIGSLEQSVSARQDFAPALVELSLAYYRKYTRTHQTEWLAKADQAAHRAQELDDTGADVHVQLGRILRMTGQNDDAIRELQTALAREPKNVAAMLQLGLVYEAANRTKDAEATYQQVIQLRPSYFAAYTNLGILYMNQGQYAKAEDPLALVVKLTPEQADPHTTLGSLYAHMNRLEDAQRELSRSIELRPTAVAYANRCGVAFNLERMDAAVEDCRHAVDLDKSNAMAWGNLADALAERPASEAEARQTYQKAIDIGHQQLAINPKNADLLASMALYAGKTRQAPLARQFAEQALAMSSVRVSVLYKAGKAFGLAGDCRRAVDLVTEALAKGYSREEFLRDPDVKRLRASSPACAIPIQ